MFNSVKKVNISAANIRTNFELSKYFCRNLPFIFFLNTPCHLDHPFPCHFERSREISLNESKRLDFAGVSPSEIQEISWRG